ncbi:hypothetical protein KVR01_011082 [Diaporthe batatas]|uniref:uncharacterized protein n=1 Tax=Diaporthe batatas TaxID=748121 RepID=UPI001D051756|nr:uncharacterized protein KVR01_011082 [Diaporthe batatas]KAG8159421.1 hypothetical protein KVR01_011082 [Diaporthe batatas]
MPSGSSSKHHHHHHSSSSSSKRHGSSSSSKHHSKGDDWSEVTEPEERRRIQNRIAQRKFREKAREQKEREERESRNEQLAGSAYQVPVPEDFMSPEGGEYGDYLSGVPWGGVSIQHMVAMGHESESRRGSRRGGLSDQQQQYGDYSAFYDPALYDAQLAGGYGAGAGGADDNSRGQQQHLGGEVLDPAGEEDSAPGKGQGTGGREYVSLFLSSPSTGRKAGDVLGSWTNVQGSMHRSVFFFQSSRQQRRGWFLVDQASIACACLLGGKTCSRPGGWAAGRESMVTCQGLTHLQQVIDGVRNTPNSPLVRLRSFGEINLGIQQSGLRAGPCFISQEDMDGLEKRHCISRKGRFGKAATSWEHKERGENQNMPKWIRHARARCVHAYVSNRQISPEEVVSA